jgi:murein DD-endopeptidase MepM/ murein hydrolase activator NlpD
MTSTFMMPAAAVIAIAVCAGNVSAEPRRGVNLLPPVSPACVSSPFGPRVLPNQPEAGSYHYGIDLPAPVGAPVIATAAGTVIRLQNKGPGGLEMLVQHDGFVGIYSHFSMVAPAFAEGKRTIAAGEQLGAVGITGVTSGAHLYFEMDLAGKPVQRGCPPNAVSNPGCRRKNTAVLPVSVWVAVLPTRQAVLRLATALALARPSEADDGHCCSTRVASR